MTDIVIYDAYVLTVNDQNQLFERGTIVVEDGRIRTVRKTREGDSTLAADRVIDAAGKLAMPGLVNAHAHLETTALFGAFSELDISELFLQLAAFYREYRPRTLGLDPEGEGRALNWPLNHNTTVMLTERLA